MLKYYIKLGFRGLLSSPWLSLAAALTLAVGQAASFTVLTLRHSLAMDPIPDRSDLLLTPHIIDGGSDVDKYTYREAKSLTQFGGDYLISGQAVGDISNADNSIHLSGQPVRYTTNHFFDFFEVPIVQGNIWGAEDDEGKSPVALISQHVGASLFPKGRAVGSYVRIGSVLYRVIGVVGQWNPTPRYYDFSLGMFMDSDAVFLPLKDIEMAPDTMGIPMSCSNASPSNGAPVASHMLDADCSWLTPWYLAKKDNVRIISFNLVRSLRSIFPEVNQDFFKVMDVKSLVASRQVIPHPVESFTKLGLSFLILCLVNATGIQLARFMRKTQVIGISRALGATKGDVLKQYLVESLLMGLLASPISAFFTFLSLAWVRNLHTFYTGSAVMDEVMYGVAIVIAMCVCLINGLLPALLVSQTSPAVAIRAV